MNISIETICNLELVLEWRLIKLVKGEQKRSEHTVIRNLIIEININLEKKILNKKDELQKIGKSDERVF